MIQMRQIVCLVYYLVVNKNKLILHVCPEFVVYQLRLKNFEQCLQNVRVRTAQFLVYQKHTRYIFICKTVSGHFVPCCKRCFQDQLQISIIIRPIE